MGVLLELRWRWVTPVSINKMLAIEWFWVTACPKKRVGGRIRADLPLLSHQRGSGAAPLRAAESGQHPAGTAIRRTGGNPEAGLWKTQPHFPKIL